MSDVHFPIAYFITFTTHGNWVHADARGSVDPMHNQFGTPRITPNRNFEKLMRERLRDKPLILNESQRKTVLRGIVHACDYYHWRLYAAHVRSNHVHILLYAKEKSDIVTTKIKSYATKFLKKHHSEMVREKYWARGKSAKHIWDFEFLSLVQDYIVEGQGKKMACYSDSMFMKE